MKTLLLSLCLIISISAFSQKTTEISIIYESKKEIVLNNGSNHKIIKETPFYAVADASIQLKHVINGENYRLNRVLLIENETGIQELIELIKGKKLYYKIRKMNAKKTENHSISGNG